MNDRLNRDLYNLISTVRECAPPKLREMIDLYFIDIDSQTTRPIHWWATVNRVDEFICSSYPSAPESIQGLRESVSWRSLAGICAAGIGPDLAYEYEYFECVGDVIHRGALVDEWSVDVLHRAHQAMAVLLLAGNARDHSLVIGLSDLFGIARTATLIGAHVRHESEWHSDYKAVIDALRRLPTYTPVTMQMLTDLHGVVARAYGELDHEFG